MEPDPEGGQEVLEQHGISLPTSATCRQVKVSPAWPGLLQGTSGFWDETCHD